MNGWEERKGWADEFLPDIKRVVKMVAGDIISVEIATDAADQTQATDYVVTVQSGEIGCRIRNWDYWQRYGDLTFRCRLASGAKTEVAKIMAGHCR